MYVSHRTQLKRRIMIGRKDGCLFGTDVVGPNGVEKREQCMAHKPASSEEV